MDLLTARRAFLAFSKTEEHREKVEKAIEIIESAEPPCLVLYSGGKDSSVVTHLASINAPRPLIIFHWDYGEIFMPRNYEQETILMLADLITDQDGVEIVLAKRPKSNIENAEVSHIYGHRAMRGTLAKVIRDFRINTILSSLRAEESNRRRAWTKRGERFMGVATLHPIAEWKWLDVFSYLASNFLPWHSHYDLRGPIEGWENLRFASFFDPEMDSFGATNVDGLLLPRWRWRSAWAANRFEKMNE